MLPAIWPGDIVTVQAREASGLLPGELLLVEDAGRLRLHRLVANHTSHGEDQLITRGDSLAYDDPPIRAAQLLGVVTSIQRGAAGYAPSRRRSRLAWLFSSSSCLGTWVTRAALRLHTLSARKETLDGVS